MPKRDNPEQAGDDMTSDEILAVVNAIRAMTGKARQRTMQAERAYPEFKERYPFLFDMVCSDDFDMGRFHWMMALKDRVEKQKNMTHEQASIQVGQALYDVYVKDKVPERKDE